ncbi:MAG TPA: thioredoxin domain-containing protein [Candidatus Saccharimonadales bacterium]|nr:thioredoxin domain-containing protein [Candidatus Saccharimonadales bacterium]
MDKRFWAIVSIIIAIFIGLLWINGGDNKEDNPSGNTKAAATEHVKGKLDSKVTLLEYGDYQCPYCAQYYVIIKQVVEKYQGQIKFQFLNLPLNQIHQNAFAAARAAEAADEQGKFWEMHDLLYEKQNEWSSSNTANAIFTSYAQQLGLNIDKFKTDFASSKVNARINADKDKFEKTGETMSTPTYFLNGKKIQASSVDEFSKLIDEALTKNQ